ncbi:uncharacterized protein LOC124536363 [Vanessa cardui]|uniref:uncharacterized protein LOC124536363 n=1 Tax=Vanessa cardui TaxID=171605 RepID=UPI001F13031B|nr:uncharacterized protein LOC124536363 [Vanessa cardui]
MSTTRKTCSGCQKAIKDRRFLRCTICSQFFEIACTNISDKSFSLMDIEKRNQWKCNMCKNKKSDNTNTPLKSTQSPIETDVLITQKNKHDITSENSIEDLSVNFPPTFVHNLMPIIRKEIQSAVAEAVKNAVSFYFAKEFDSIKNDLATLKDLKSTIEFISADYDKVKTDLNTYENKVKVLSEENKKLSDTIINLSNRMTLLEQHSRENNIELSGVPENKSENLITIIKQLASTVSAPLQDADIVNCVRVRKMDETSSKPRSIIVKLNSTRARDEVLAAVSKFNKSNRENKLHTGHLGFGTKKTPIYVSEHLSPHLKYLYARTRQAAHEKGVTYVWIRNGRIFVRKNDTSPAKQIRHIEALENI